MESLPLQQSSYGKDGYDDDDCDDYIQLQLLQLTTTSTNMMRGKKGYYSGPDRTSRYEFSSILIIIIVVF
jgi:hypothetical protein